MANVLPVASGKGGVGKSSLSVNAAIALSRLGRKTVLVDVDLGGSNLHTLLGLRNNHIGLGNFIYHQTEDLHDLIQETGIPNLWFISGDCLMPGTPEMRYNIKLALMKGLSALEADFVIMDLGAGSGGNTIDFFLMTYNGMLVTTPELTSVLNAYSFLKAAVYRLLYAQFPRESEEYNFITDYITTSDAGAGNSFREIWDMLNKRYPRSMAAIVPEFRKYRPQIVMNMGEKTKDLDILRRLRSLVSAKLCIELDFMGFVSRDEGVSLAIAKRKPLIVSVPDGQFAREITALGEKLCQGDYSINDKVEFDDNIAVGGRV